MDRMLTVKGIGKVSAAPDLLVIDIDLDIVSAEYGKAVELATRTLSELQSSLTHLGLPPDGLKTVSYSVNTKYESIRDYRSEKMIRQFVGYECAHRLRLDFDLDMQMLAQVIDVIVACKANPRFSIRFSVKNPDALSDQLLENAISDATHKATILAKAANVTLGAIVRIDYNWGEIEVYSNTRLMMADSMMADSMIAPMSITPDDIDVNDTVAVVWALL